MFYEEGEARRSLGSPGEPARSWAAARRWALCLGSRSRRDLQGWKSHTCISKLLAWLPKPGRQEVVKPKQKKII